MDTNNIANTQGSWRSRSSYVKLSDIISIQYSSYLENIEYVEIRDGSYSGSLIETIYPYNFENVSFLFIVIDF